MADRSAVRTDPGGPGAGRVCPDGVGAGDVLSAGLWLLRLSAGPLSSRVLLAWRIALVESAELQRSPLPRAMEHAHALSGLASLPAAAAAVVAQPVQPGPPGSGRAGDVCPGPA